jgi:sirohydrochlorin cobaltochelatase
MTALVLFAHGSPVESANEPVRVLARQAGEQGGFPFSIAAFLDGGEPDLSGAVRRAVSAGARRIVVVPFFLTMGLHLRRDVPRIATELRHVHPGVTIEVTEPLEGHPALLRAVLDRAIDHGGSSSESEAG